MASGEKVASMARLSTRVHDFPNLEHREREGDKMSPSMPSAWPRVCPHDMLHGRQQWSSSELMARALGHTKSHGN